ncbi:MAG: PP2C family protein-serine/threonine phosphatase [Candidatus Eisenbacteria bacterium]|uniref:PP2C family protein-serine/threonine phosphatase n=1 Tax=Eiseniibacteriota bacterium TaxID=2212470 RepID=A0A849T205_UNCEI|nr:PP2C family protein-serine/threonine phosphatase [Candidatus Eisenbacteria bacterium]
MSGWVEGLATKVAGATGRAELAGVLHAQLRDAFEPHTLAVFLQRADGRLVAMTEVPAEISESLPDDYPLLASLSRERTCVTSSHALAGELAHAPLTSLAAECAVPVLDRRAQLIGLFVLGARRGGERYADEDQRLLLAAADEAGFTLEAIRRAELLADRMEAARRQDREIAIAREVQSRLFPQRVPVLQNLELAARCMQARSVGGDYYDFLELGPRQLGFVIADVSGKGVHAALRMANLQAHLRSQAGSAPQDPLRVLREVNRMMCEAAVAGHFATLFLGVFADSSRRLTFINCGHNPPLCLRRDGSVEWLGATATVLGAFVDWDCALGRVQLAPGDLLVAYSDGITEATRGEEQFGDERLLGVLREHAAAPVEAIVSAVLEAVQAFSAGEQSDDLTLMVGRVR